MTSSVLVSFTQPINVQVPLHPIAKEAGVYISKELMPDPVSPYVMAHDDPKKFILSGRPSIRSDAYRVRWNILKCCMNGGKKYVLPPYALPSLTPHTPHKLFLALDLRHPEKEKVEVARTCLRNDSEKSIDVDSRREMGQTKRTCRRTTEEELKAAGLIGATSARIAQGRRNRKLLD